MRRIAILLAGSLLAGTAALSTAAPAQATDTWYASCGPKVNILSGMSGIQTIRQANINYVNTSYVQIRLNRGFKAGYTQGAIWWAKLDAPIGSVAAGDQANLNWTDYEPADRANYCRDTVKTGESYALTWGINAVASSANSAHRRMFSAYGRKGSMGAGAAYNPISGEWEKYWVASY